MEENNVKATQKKSENAQIFHLAQSIANFLHGENGHNARFHVAQRELEVKNGIDIFHKRPNMVAGNAHLIHFYKRLELVPIRT